MAGTHGTELLFKKESQMGMTTLTFRSKRYTFPSVIVKSDFKSEGMCVMLDVGMFCPFCTGTYHAKLVSSKARLAISKSSSYDEAMKRLEHMSSFESCGSSCETHSTSSSSKVHCEQNGEANTGGLKYNDSFEENVAKFESTFAEMKKRDTKHQHYASEDKLTCSSIDHVPKDGASSAKKKKTKSVEGNEAKGALFVETKEAQLSFRHDKISKYGAKCRRQTFQLPQKGPNKENAPQTVLYQDPKIPTPELLLKGRLCGEGGKQETSVTEKRKKRTEEDSKKNTEIITEVKLSNQKTLSNKEGDDVLSDEDITLELKHITNLEKGMCTTRAIKSIPVELFMTDKHDKRPTPVIEGTIMSDYGSLEFQSQTTSGVSLDNISSGEESSHRYSHMRRKPRAIDRIISVEDRTKHSSLETLKPINTRAEEASWSSEDLHRFKMEVHHPIALHRYVGRPFKPIRRHRRRVRDRCTQTSEEFDSIPNLRKLDEEMMGSSEERENFESAISIANKALLEIEEDQKRHSYTSLEPPPFSDINTSHLSSTEALDTAIDDLSTGRIRRKKLKPQVIESDTSGKENSGIISEEEIEKLHKMIEELPVENNVELRIINESTLEEAVEVIQETSEETSVSTLQAEPLYVGANEIPVISLIPAPKTEVASCVESPNVAEKVCNKKTPNVLVQSPSTESGESHMSEGYTYQRFYDIDNDHMYSSEELLDTEKEIRKRNSPSEIKRLIPSHSKSSSSESDEVFEDDDKDVAESHLNENTDLSDSESDEDSGANLSPYTPEDEVDDILENIEDSICYSPDSTLPRGFALPKEGKKLERSETEESADVIIHRDPSPETVLDQVLEEVEGLESTFADLTSDYGSEPNKTPVLADFDDEDIATLRSLQLVPVPVEHRRSASIECFPDGELSGGRSSCGSSDMSYKVFEMEQEERVPHRIPGVDVVRFYLSDSASSSMERGIDDHGPHKNVDDSAPQVITGDVQACRLDSMQTAQLLMERPPELETIVERPEEDEISSGRGRSVSIEGSSIRSADTQSETTDRDSAQLDDHPLVHDSYDAVRILSWKRGKKIKEQFYEDSTTVEKGSTIDMMVQTENTSIPVHRELKRTDISPAEMLSKTSKSAERTPSNIRKKKLSSESKQTAIDALDNLIADITRMQSDSSLDMTTDSKSSDGNLSDDMAEMRTSDEIPEVPKQYHQTAPQEDWTHFVEDAATDEIEFHSSECFSKEQAAEFMRHMLANHAHEHHHNEQFGEKEGKVMDEEAAKAAEDLSARLSEIVQAEGAGNDNEEKVISEEITTKEVTLVFVYPKRKGAKPLATGPNGEPFREIHMRRVTRIDNSNNEIVEGPKIASITDTRATTTKGTDKAKTFEKERVSQGKSMPKPSTGSSCQDNVLSHSENSSSASKTVSASFESEKKLSKVSAVKDVRSQSKKLKKEFDQELEVNYSEAHGKTSKKKLKEMKTLPLNDNSSKKCDIQKEDEILIDTSPNKSVKSVIAMFEGTRRQCLHGPLPKITVIEASDTESHEGSNHHSTVPTNEISNDHPKVKQNSVPGGDLDDLLPENEDINDDVDLTGEKSNKSADSQDDKAPGKLAQKTTTVDSSVRIEHETMSASFTEDKDTQLKVHSQGTAFANVHQVDVQVHAPCDAYSPSLSQEAHKDGISQVSIADAMLVDKPVNDTHCIVKPSSPVSENLHGSSLNQESDADSNQALQDGSDLKALEVTVNDTIEKEQHKACVEQTFSTTSVVSDSDALVHTIYSRPKEVANNNVYEYLDKVITDCIQIALDILDEDKPNKAPDTKGDYRYIVNYVDKIIEDAFARAMLQVCSVTFEEHQQSELSEEQKIKIQTEHSSGVDDTEEDTTSLKIENSSIVDDDEEQGKKKISWCDEGDSFDDIYSSEAAAILDSEPPAHLVTENESNVECLAQMLPENESNVEPAKYVSGTTRGDLITFGYEEHRHEQYVDKPDIPWVDSCIDVYNPDDSGQYVSHAPKLAFCSFQTIYEEEEDDIESMEQLNTDISGKYMQNKQEVIDIFDPLVCPGGSVAESSQSDVVKISINSDIYSSKPEIVEVSFSSNDDSSVSEKSEANKDVTLTENGNLNSQKKERKKVLSASEPNLRGHMSPKQKMAALRAALERRFHVSEDDLVYQSFRSMKKGFDDILKTKKMTRKSIREGKVQRDAIFHEDLAKIHSDKFPTRTVIPLKKCSSFSSLLTRKSHINNSYKNKTVNVSLDEENQHCIRVTDTLNLIVQNQHKNGQFNSPPFTEHKETGGLNKRLFIPVRHHSDPILTRYSKTHSLDSKLEFDDRFSQRIIKRRTRSLEDTRCHRLSSTSKSHWRTFKC